LDGWMDGCLGKVREDTLKKKENKGLGTQLIENGRREDRFLLFFSFLILLLFP